MTRFAQPPFIISYGRPLDAKVQDQLNAAQAALAMLQMACTPEFIKTIDTVAQHNPTLLIKLAYYQSYANCLAIQNLAPLAQSTCHVKN